MKLSELSYKDIELTHAQKALLKKLRKNTLAADSDHLKEKLMELEELNLVARTNDPEYFYGHQKYLVFEITGVGKMLLRYLLRNSWRFWYPHIISTLALAIAILSLILGYLRS